MLLRNLVTYRHVEGIQGDAPVPDLATDTGQVSSDGLTYTFKLKQGVKFAPPVSRVLKTSAPAGLRSRTSTFLPYWVNKPVDTSKTPSNPIY